MTLLAAAVLAAISSVLQHAQLLSAGHALLQALLAACLQVLLLLSPIRWRLSEIRISVSGRCTSISRSPNIF